jgi:hypothetical protein
MLVHPSRRIVVHPVILLTQEAEIRKIVVRGLSRQKVCKNHLNNKNLGMIACTCHPTYIGRIYKKIAVLANLGIE